jgi:hypothetical protein
VPAVVNVMLKAPAKDNHKVKRPPGFNPFLVPEPELLVRALWTPLPFPPPPPWTDDTLGGRCAGPRTATWWC